jgi:ABC-type glutathione transport system ATPase component
VRRAEFSTREIQTNPIPLRIIRTFVAIQSGRLDRQETKENQPRGQAKKATIEHLFCLPGPGLLRARMIHVRQLGKRYSDLNGDFIALDRVSFDVLPGQIYGLLGPNGAGKTTLLRILCTVLKPTSGTAIVNGFDILEHAEQVRRSLGFVSTNTAVYDRMTGWEMIEYFGKLYGLPHAVLQSRLEQLFDRFKMNDIRNVLGSNMSTKRLPAWTSSPLATC